MDVNGISIRCWLDGKLIHDLNYETGGKIKSLYATSATDAQSGDIIVKVVNANPAPLETELDLSGANNLAGKGTVTVLTSENATDENSLDDPLKVSPKSETLSFNGTTLTRSFPGNSLTVLRLQTK